MELKRFTALYENDRLEKITSALLNGDHDERKKALKSIHNFLFAPDLIREKTGIKSIQNFNIQNFTTKGDFPEIDTNIQKVFNKIQNYDDRYLYAFSQVQFDPNRDFIEILDVDNLISFDKIEEGGRVNIYRLGGSVGIVKAVTYGAGLGWTYDLLEDRKFGLIVQIAERFRDAWYHRLSRVHYTLLAEAGYDPNNANAGATVPFAGPVTDPDALRVIKTIDTAAQLIGNAIKDLGIVPDPAIANCIVYCNPRHYTRILNAVRPVSGFLSNSYATIVRDIQVYPTYNLIRANGTAYSSDDIIVVVPGGKNVTATKLPPTEYTRQDIETFSTITTVRARIAAAIGEPKQVVRATIA